MQRRLCGGQPNGTFRPIEAEAARAKPHADDAVERRPGNRHCRRFRRRSRPSRHTSSKVVQSGHKFARRKCLKLSAGGGRIIEGTNPRRRFRSSAFFAAFFLFLEDAYARTTGQICVRGPASDFSGEACSALPSTWPPASSCDSYSASRSTSAAVAMRETPVKGNARSSPRRFAAVGSSALSMSHEALAFSLRRGPFSSPRGCLRFCPDLHVPKRLINQARLSRSPRLSPTEAIRLDEPTRISTIAISNQASGIVLVVDPP